MAISFVAAATSLTATTSGTSYTLNAPAGLAAGDVMIAALAFFPGTGGSSVSVTLPSGWTTIKMAYGNASGDVQVTVMTRTATASEPGSWSGSIGTSSAERITQVVAYRGVQAVGVSGTSSTGNTASFSTATVNNTVANSWRVVVGAYSSSTANYDISSNEAVNRDLDSAVSTDGGTEVAIWDSNASISTGNTSKTVSRAFSWSVAVSVILTLQPTTGTAATGAWASTLGNASFVDDGASEVHDDATAVVALQNASFLGDGFGTPPNVTGTASVACQNATAVAAGGTDVLAAMAVVCLPSVDFEAETRAFGIRVIEVEFDESRIITVPSRGVDD